MEIKVTLEDILKGDISKIKTCLDKIAPDSRLSAENESNISIKFGELKSFELALKLQEPQCKAWFKKLDSEYPYLPFFLNKQSKTLMFFIMGNTKFSIDEHNNICFDEASKQQYLSAKKSSIKAFCFTHNIDPKPATRNLISFEPVQPKQTNVKVIKIQDYLNKFGAITTFDEHRELVTWLLADEVPPSIKILLCSCIQNCPQPFFDIIIEYSGVRKEYTSTIIPSKKDVEEFCRMKSSMKIIFVFKDGDSHQSWDLEHPFSCLEPAELEKKRNELMLSAETAPEDESTPEKSEAPENGPDNHEETEETKENASPAEEPQQEIQEIKEEPAEETKAETGKTEEADEPEEVIPQNETPEETIARLTKKVHDLQEKIKQKNNLIEDLERALNERQRSKIVTFLKGLFK